MAAQCEYEKGWGVGGWDVVEEDDSEGDERGTDVEFGVRSLI